jgi:copper chaperone CopZ
MRNILVAILACVLCSVFSAPAFAKADKQVVVLSCDLHCQGCCDKIMKNIAFERGVKDLVCDLKTKTVTVTYDANKTDVPTLLEAFEKIGKPAKVKEQVESQKPKVDSTTDANTGASQPY